MTPSRTQLEDLWKEVRQVTGENPPSLTLKAESIVPLIAHVFAVVQRPGATDANMNKAVAVRQENGSWYAGVLAEVSLDPVNRYRTVHAVDGMQWWKECTEYDAALIGRFT